MWKYNGFIIINHQDIGYYAVYREDVTAFNVVQASNLFVKKQSCYEWIDRVNSGYFNNHGRR